jgi:tetratricopeptide (TPR) repeat protein
VGLAIAERLAAADATNTGWQRDLSVGHNQVGYVLEAQGDLAGALTAYRAAVAIRERLAAADATNAVWQRDLSVSHERVGRVLEAQGDLGGALTAYRAGLAIRERLAAADATNTEWQRDLWIACWRVADALEGSGDPTADEWWQRAFDILAGMKRAGMYISPADEEYYEQLRQKLGR